MRVVRLAPPHSSGGRRITEVVPSTEEWDGNRIGLARLFVLFGNSGFEFTYGGLPLNGCLVTECVKVAHIKFGKMENECVIPIIPMLMGPHLNGLAHIVNRMAVFDKIDSEEDA